MLAAVEQELADEPVVVVGVHSPKFPTEGDGALVREAVRRHGVTHPVVVDTGHAVRDAYGVRSWPTLVVVRPDGTIRGTASGEPDRGPLVALLREVLAEQPERLVRDPLPLRPGAPVDGALAHPGGIVVIAGSGGQDEAFVVADTGHHQLVVCAADGTERRRIGAGAPGLVDGAPRVARLRHPHGLAIDTTTATPSLLVADTGNHAIRRVDLATGAVATVAGTGHRGRGGVTAGEARRTDLRSPWDVAVDPGGATIVAMAGSHQLWGIEESGPITVAAVLAGSGREARVDGDLATAAFAQPSGLAQGPRGALFVADSEISAVRRMAGGVVTTVAGGDLFAYGLVDGTGDEARFMHPVGIAAAAGGHLDGLLVVADTLNHAVRAVDPRSGEVRTLMGDGTPFDAALAALERRPALPDDVRVRPCCREPEAVAWDGERLLVVDTGNHRVLAVDPATGAATVLAGAATVLAGGAEPPPT